MKPLALILLFTTIMTSTPLFNFTKDANTSNWRIVDDVVIGGRSNGNLSLNNNGHGVFSSERSLENNSGFSSLRYDTETIAISKHTKASITLKGDGKNYPFRIKANRKDATLTLPLLKLLANGKPLLLIQKICIQLLLIGNKKTKSFELLIDSIELKQQLLSQKNNN